MMEASTAEADVAVGKNTPSNHSPCDRDTLILKLTMPGGLPAIREGYRFSVVSAFTCCPAQGHRSDETW